MVEVLGKFAAKALEIRAIAAQFRPSHHNSVRILPLLIQNSPTMRSGVVALSAKDGATLVAWKNKETLGW